MNAKPMIRVSKDKKAPADKRYTCFTRCNYEFKRGCGAIPADAYGAWSNDSNPIKLTRPFTVWLSGLFA